MWRVQKEEEKEQIFPLHDYRECIPDGEGVEDLPFVIDANFSKPRVRPGRVKLKTVIMLPRQ